MKLVLQRLRSHRVLLGISICLLLGEAAMCLASPVLLGSYIQTGCVRGGFTESCPKLLSRDAAALCRAFLPEDERQTFDALYAPSDDPAAILGADYQTDKVCVCLRADADETRAAELYRNTVLAAVLAVRKIDGYESLHYRELIDRFAGEAIRQGGSRLSFTQAEQEALFRKASETPRSVKEHAAGLLLPYLYRDAGVDCGARQAWYMTRVCAAMAVCAAAQGLFAVLSAFTRSRLSCAVESDLRSGLLRRTIGCTQEDLYTFSPSALARLLSDGTRQIGMLLHYGLRIVFYCAFVALAGCIYAFFANVWFGVLIVAGSAVIFGALIAVYKITAPRYARMQTRYTQYSRTVRANLRHAFAIRAGAATETEEAAVRAQSSLIRQDERFVAGAVFFALSFSGLLVNLLTGALVLVGGRSLTQSGITVGTIIAAFQIALLTVGALMALEAAVVFAPRALSAAREMQSVLDARLHCDDFADNTRQPDGIREIAFCDACAVPFAAPVALRVCRGEVVALTGANAVGKSSLLRALLREQRLCTGEILVNGENITSFSPSYPGEWIAFCGSEPVLFTGTVRENMRLYGAPADDRRMREALRVCACDFFRADDPLDVYLENAGENLSGGQRSRLALACAVAKPADVYILDDCLSAVDAATRRRILDGLTAWIKDAVTLLVARDADTLSWADRTVTLTACAPTQGGDAHG